MFINLLFWPFLLCLLAVGVGCGAVFLLRAGMLEQVCNSTRRPASEEENKRRGEKTRTEIEDSCSSTNQRGQADRQTLIKKSSASIFEQFLDLLRQSFNLSTSEAFLVSLLVLIFVVGMVPAAHAQLDEILDLSGDFNSWPSDPDNMTYGGESSQAGDFPDYKIWYATIQISSASNNEFKFENWDWGNQWSTEGNVNLNSIYYDVTYNAGNLNNMALQSLTDGNYYTFRFYDEGYTGNCDFAVLETSASPISISSVQDLEKVSSGVAPHIKITLSASKSAEENVLVRYTTDGWSSSSVVKAYGSGSTYYARIPEQSAGTTVEYYAITTTVSESTYGGYSSDYERDLVTLSGDNNGGSNYSYDVGDYPVVTEVMVNPTDEYEMEFVEIYNPTGSSIDVNSYDIGDGSSWDDIETWDSGKDASANLNDPDPTTNSTSIPANSYAVILDHDYGSSGETPYDFPASATILTGGAALGSSGFSNSSNETISLRDSGDSIVSTFASGWDYSSLDENSYSFEKIDRDEGDTEGNWRNTKYFCYYSNAGVLNRATAGGKNSSPQQPRDIVISEVFWDGSTEWTELYNRSSTECVILGDGSAQWDLKIGGSGEWSASTMDDTVVMPGSYFLIADGNDFRNTTPDLTDAVNYNESGEQAELVDLDGNSIDSTPTTYPNIGKDGEYRSFQRVDVNSPGAGTSSSNWRSGLKAFYDTNEAQWHGGTPGEAIENYTITTVGIYITEVMEGDSEYLELYNHEADPILIAGWSLFEGTTEEVNDIDIGETIPSQKYCLIEDEEAATTIPADIVDAISINATIDQLVLYDGGSGSGSDVEVDTAGDGGNWYSPLDNVSVEKSRVKLTGDGSNNDNWGNSCGSYGGVDGTPDTTNCYGENTAPDTPTILSPTGGAPLNTYNPTFDWSFNDSDSGDTQGAYQVVAYNNSSLTDTAWNSGKVSTATSETTCQVNLSTHNTYYWRVRTWDDYGETSPWSDGSDTFVINRRICDGDGSDWASFPALSDQTVGVSNDEFAWEDANGDERDNPQPDFDIDRWRFIADTNYLYVLVKMNNEEDGVGNNVIIQLAVDTTTTSADSETKFMGRGIPEAATHVNEAAEWESLLIIDDRDGSGDTTYALDPSFTKTGSGIYTEHHTNNVFESAIPLEALGVDFSDTIRVSLGLFKNDDAGNVDAWGTDSDVDLVDCMSSKDYTYGSSGSNYETTDNDQVINEYCEVFVNNEGSVVRADQYKSKSADGSLGDWYPSLEKMETVEGKTLYLSWDNNNIYVAMNGQDNSTLGDIGVFIDTLDNNGVGVNQWGAGNRGMFQPEYWVGLEDADYLEYRPQTDGTWDAAQNVTDEPGWDFFSGYSGDTTTEIIIPRSWLDNHPSGAHFAVAVVNYWEDQSNVDMAYPFGSLNEDTDVSTTTYLRGMYHFEGTEAGVDIPSDGVDTTPPQVNFTSFSPVADSEAADTYYFKISNLSGGLAVTSTTKDTSYVFSEYNGLQDSSVQWVWNSTTDADDQADTDSDENGDFSISGLGDDSDGRAVFSIIARNYTGYTAEDTVYMILDSTGPSLPTLQTPADGEDTWTADVSFSWTDSVDTAGHQDYYSGFSHYQLQVDTQSTFASPMVINDTLTASDSAISGLNEGITYHWRIVAYDNVGCTSGWTSADTFQYLSPPASVGITSPSDNHDTCVESITVSGTTANAEAGDSVEIMVDGVVQGSAAEVQADADSSWTVSNVTLNGLGDAVEAMLYDTSTGGRVADTHLINVNYKPCIPLFDTFSVEANGATEDKYGCWYTEMGSGGSEQWEVQNNEMEGADLDEPSTFATRVLDSTDLEIARVKVSIRADTTNDLESTDFIKAVVDTGVGVVKIWEFNDQTGANAIPSEYTEQTNIIGNSDTVLLKIIADNNMPGEAINFDTVSIQNAPPSVSIASPVVGHDTSASEISVKGTTINTTSSDTVEIYTNESLNTTVTVDASGDWSGTAAISGVGDSVVAKLYSGSDVDWDTHTVNYRVSSVGITSPVDGYDTTQSPITVAGTTAWSFSGDSVYLYVNGSLENTYEITADSESWSASVNLEGLGDSVSAYLKTTTAQVSADTVNGNYYPPPNRGEVKITEFMGDQPGTENNEEYEYVELYNDSSATFDLGEMYLDDLEPSGDAESSDRLIPFNGDIGTSTADTTSTYLSPGQFAVVLDKDYDTATKIYEFPSNCIVLKQNQDGITVNSGMAGSEDLMLNDGTATKIDTYVVDQATSGKAMELSDTSHTYSRNADWKGSSISSGEVVGGDQVFGTPGEAYDTVPVAPAINAPVSEDTTYTTISFDWTHNDNEGKYKSQSRYQIQVDNNSDFSSPVVDTTVTTSNSDTQIGEFARDQTYYWRVRTWSRNDYYDTGHWSDGSDTFRVLPVHVNITSPADGHDTNVATIDVSGTSTNADAGDSVIITVNGGKVDETTVDNNADSTWTATSVDLTGMGDSVVAHLLRSGSGSDTLARDTITVNLDTTAPDSVVQNPAVSDTGHYAVELGWDAFTSDPDTQSGFGEYVIFYKQGTGVTSGDNTWSSDTDSRLGSMSTDTTIITGLADNQQYSFKVGYRDQATNLGDNLSAEVSVTTREQTLVINEVLYDPSAEPAGEFIELYNNGDTFLIDGLHLEESGGDSWVIPDANWLASAGETFTVANDASQFRTDYGYLPDFAAQGTAGDGSDTDVGSSFGLGNTGDYIILYDDSGETLDIVSWEGGYAGMKQADNNDNDGHSVDRVKMGDEGAQVGGAASELGEKSEELNQTFEEEATPNPETGGAISPYEIAITNPGDGHDTHVTSIDVSGTTAGAGDGDSVRIYVEGSVEDTTTVTGGNWNFSGVNLPAEGNNEVMVKLYLEGTTSVVVAEASIIVDLDTVVPLVGITSPASGGSTTAVKIDLSGTSANSEAGDTVQIYVNGSLAGDTPIYTANSDWTVTEVALEAGGNTIVARIIDPAGNFSEDTITKTLEAASVLINEVSPSGDGGGSGDDWVELYVSSGGVMPSGYYMKGKTGDSVFLDVLTGSLSAGEYIVIHDNSTGTSDTNTIDGGSGTDAGDTYWDIYEQAGSEEWGIYSTSSWIKIYNSNDVLVDAVIWDDFDNSLDEQPAMSEAISAGEWAQAGDVIQEYDGIPSAGNSPAVYYRDEVSTDTNSKYGWDFVPAVATMGDTNDGTEFNKNTGSGTIIQGAEAAVPGASGVTLEFTYTPGVDFGVGGRNGYIEMKFPGSWPEPSLTDSNAPGYLEVTAQDEADFNSDPDSAYLYSVGADSYLVIIMGSNFSTTDPDTVGITYGSRGGGGPGLTVPSGTGTDTFWVSSDPSGNNVKRLPAANQATVERANVNSITVDPSSATNPAGSLDTIEARAYSAAGKTLLGAQLAYEITAAPGPGTEVTDTTPASGKTERGKVVYDFQTDPNTAGDNSLMIHLSGNTGIADTFTDATTTDATADTLVLNEFMPNPDSLDHDNDGTFDDQDEEFIEIYNPTASSVNVDSWVIAVASSGISAELEGSIPANGYLVLYASGASSNNEEIYIYDSNGDTQSRIGLSVNNFYTAHGLNNTEDTVTLEDDNGVLLDQKHYTSTTADKSWARKLDGCLISPAWLAAADPTPGPTNQVDQTGPANGKIRFNLPGRAISTKDFSATVWVTDPNGDTITCFYRDVDLGVIPGLITPDTVSLDAGVFSGSLNIDTADSSSAVIAGTYAVTTTGTESLRIVHPDIDTSSLTVGDGSDTLSRPEFNATRALSAGDTHQFSVRVLYTDTVSVYYRRDGGVPTTGDTELALSNSSADTWSGTLAPADFDPGDSISFMVHAALTGGGEEDQADSSGVGYVYRVKPVIDTGTIEVTDSISTLSRDQLDGSNTLNDTPLTFRVNVTGADSSVGDTASMFYRLDGTPATTADTELVLENVSDTLWEGKPGPGKIAPGDTMNFILITGIGVTGGTDRADSAGAGYEFQVVSGNEAPSVQLNYPDSTAYVGGSAVGGTYVLTDADNDYCTVTVEISDDSGATWDTEATLSGSVNSVLGDANGETYTFNWDSLTDMGYTHDTQVKLRIKAYDGTDTGAYDTSAAFTVVNPSPYSGPIWYVSQPRGDDELHNGSYKYPFKTVGKALKMTSDGDTVMIVDNSTHEIASGLLVDTSNLTFTTGTDSDPTIKGTVDIDSGIFEIAAGDTGNGLSLIGLHIDADSQFTYAVRPRETISGLYVHDCLIENFTSAGIYANVSSNGKIDSNVIRNGSTEDGNLEAAVLADGDPDIGSMEITNNDIYGFLSVGIKLYEGSGILVENNNLHDLWGGIELDGSGRDNCEIEANSINNLTGFGIKVNNNPDSIYIYNNDLVDCSDWGAIYISSATNCRVDSNSVTGSFGGGGRAGILVENNSSSCTVTENYVAPDDNDRGIRVDGSSAILVRDNTCTGATNYEGIVVENSSSDVTVASNLLQAGGGIVIRNSSHGCTVTGNTAQVDITNPGVYLLDSDTAYIHNNTLSNASFGVWVDTSHYTTIDSNVINNQNEDGIQLRGSDSVTISNNEIENANWYSIDLQYSVYTTIDTNVCESVTGHGIMVQKSSDYADIRYNTVRRSGNTNNGIYVLNSDTPYFYKNLVHDNTADGIKLQGSSGWTILRNILEDNGGAGVALDGTDNGTFNFNTVYGNGSFGIWLGNNNPGCIFKNSALASNGTEIDMGTDNQTISYSLIEDNDTNLNGQTLTEDTCIFSSPGFIQTADSTAVGFYRPGDTSPCIDAGDPADNDPTNSDSAYWVTDIGRYPAVAPAISIAITSPVDNHDTEVQVIDVSGTTANTSAGDTVSIYTNGTWQDTVFVQYDGTWSGTAALTGADSIMVKLHDKYDRYTQDTITVIYNPLAAVQLLYPDSTAYVGGSAVSGTYVLTDADNDYCTVTVEISDDSGATWDTEATLSGSVNSVLGDANGETYTFNWDALADLGSVYDTQVKLRMKAYDGTDTGAYDTSAAFTVDNRAPPQVADLASTAGVTPDPDTGVFLTWTPGDTDYQSFNIYRVQHTPDTSQASVLTTLATTGDTITYRDASVTYGDSFFYYVTAVDTAGNESDSSNATSAPHVTISKTDNGDSLHRPGDTIIYTISYVNDGFGPTDIIGVIDAVPDSVTLTDTAEVVSGATATIEYKVSGSWKSSSYPRDQVTQVRWAITNNQDPLDPTATTGELRFKVTVD